MLGAPLASSLILQGCDAAPKKDRFAGSLLGPSMKHGHKLWQPKELAPVVSSAAPAVDVLIVGGGPSALAAAWQLERQGVRNYRILELEGAVGGTSVSGRSAVTAYPWGAHYLPMPMRENTDLLALLSEMGAIVGSDAEGAPVGAEECLVREPDERVFFRGFWYPGLYPRAGASKSDIQELDRFQAKMGQFAALKDAGGRRAFAIPVDESAQLEETLHLDTITASAWLSQEAFTSKRLLWLAEYACRDDFGTTLETTSAWALVHYFASRMRNATSEAQEILTWPEGNGALVAHLSRSSRTKTLAGVLVTNVATTSAGVEVTTLNVRTQQRERHTAKRAIVAVPQFVASRLVDGMQRSPFVHGAWLVANLHLRDRPTSRGFPFAWDNVLYDSPSVGYVVATHQRGREFGKSVWTYYLPLTESDAAGGRRRLLAHSLGDWQEAVVADLSRAHTGLREQIERVDVWRWGHGMVQPRVGLLWGGAREQARAPMGNVHFAHSDLSGMALFEEAFYQGVRAAREVAAAIETAK